MDYQSALSYIHSFDSFGSILGMERISELLNRLGDPQKRLKFIHIAGTNGKGSTTAMCARILSECGYRTGMYISPYVIDFRERMQINGEMITKDTLADLVSRVKPQVEQMQAAGITVTEFEVVTATAMLYFAEQNCDIVCLEVGLGGRYDATNVIDTPLVSVLASISLDHVSVLGDTVEKIAYEKAGIIKENGTTVCYPKQDADALAVIMEQCAIKNNRLILPNAAHIELLRSDLYGSKFRYDDECYHVSLIGEHQVYNAAMVVEIMKCLREKGFSIPQDTLKAALRDTTFPARFEIVSDAPLTVIDGAHNQSGALSLANTLRTLGNPNTVAIMAMMADKDHETALSLIAPHCKAVIAVSASNPRCLAPERLADEVSAYCDTVYSESDHKAALEKARALAGTDGMVVICGSLYLAGDIRDLAKA